MKLDKAKRLTGQVRGEAAYAAQNANKLILELKKKLKAAKRDKKRLQEEKTDLAEETEELRRHLDPTNKELEEFQSARRDELTLRREHCKMYQGLATRATAALIALGDVDFRSLGVLDAGVHASYPRLFSLIVESMEKMARSGRDPAEEGRRSCLRWVAT